MEFQFRRAGQEDISVIRKMILEAKAKMEDPDWFETEDEEYARRHICEEGFTILAEDAGSGQAAGIMMVRFPGEQEDNLGIYLHLSEKEMQQVAHLEIAVVAPEFQGNQLQYRMFCETERMLAGTNYRYLMSTVHPDNIYSLRNMERLGMHPAAKERMYGGKLRYVMWKTMGDRK